VHEHVVVCMKNLSGVTILRNLELIAILLAHFNWPSEYHLNLEFSRTEHS